MKINLKNKKQLQIMIFVLVAVITLGVGYAAITAINLVINGNATATENQENFKVKFTTAAVTTGTGTAAIDTNDPKVATFDVTGLTKVGDTAVATYTVLNDSSGIGASIDLTVTNSNTEYFSVTERVADTELQAGETTTATITVTLTKTPTEAAVTTSITGTLTASPLENAQATGGSEKTIVNPKEYVFTANTSSNKTYVGQAIPNGVTKHQTFDSAASTLYGRRQALMHLIDNGVISESYVQFKRDGVTYTLRGGINEEDLPEANREIYKENVQVLTNAFGANKCRTEVDEDFDNWVTYFCQIGGDNASVTTTGHVSYAGGFSYCRVDASYTGPSSSYCYTS